MASYRWVRQGRSYTLVEEEGFPAVDDAPHVEDVKEDLDGQEAPAGELVEPILSQLEGVEGINTCLDSLDILGDNWKDLDVVN